MTNTLSVMSGMAIHSLKQKTTIQGKEGRKFVNNNGKMNTSFGEENHKGWISQQGETNPKPSFWEQDTKMGRRRWSPLSLIPFSFLYALIDKK